MTSTTYLVHVDYKADKDSPLKIRCAVSRDASIIITIGNVPDNSRLFLSCETMKQARLTLESLRYEIDKALKEWPI